MTHLAITVARAVAAVVMTLLWRANLWLLVGIGAAITFVLVRRRVTEHLWWRPTRVALSALHPADVARHRTIGTHVPVPDIVVEARGRTTVLDRAGDLLRDSDDVRRWSVGAERLAVARCFITDTAPFVVPRRRQRSLWTVAAWAVVTGLTATLLASGGGRWTAIAYVAAFTATTATLTDLREEGRWQPRLVAWLAGDLAAHPRDGGARRSAPEHLAATAVSPSVIRRATRIVEQSNLGPDQRAAAVAHLDEAQRVLGHGPRGHRLKWIVLHLPYLVAGWLTWWMTL